MKISIICGHPDTESFNHAICRAAVKQLEYNGHEVIFHDLYKEGFDPVLLSEEISADAVFPPMIEVHCREIVQANGIIIVHPNWWGQPPAILKGWVDRVIRPDVAYKFLEGDAGEGVPVGLLKAETAIIFNTSNTPYDREIKVFGDPLENLWKNCIFDLCGAPVFFRRMFSVIVTSTLDQRRKWLLEVRDIINDKFPENNIKHEG